MSTKTKRNSEISYGRDGRFIYGVFNGDNIVTRVCDWYDNLEVQYNDKERKPENYQPVTKKEFNSFVKQAQAKYGVKFSIKTEWGTNETN